MKNVRWSDNVCTVGGTCIHGYFTLEDLSQLFELCDDPDATFTPTFYHERLGPCGFIQNDLESIRTLGEDEESRKVYSPLHKGERGYYFTFMERYGERLLTWLKERYPMVRKEGCN
jgi:hypothetical protein